MIECGICTSTFNNSKYQIILTCDHYICSNCFIKLFLESEKGKCPYCRTDLKPSQLSLWKFLRAGIKTGSIITIDFSLTNRAYINFRDSNNRTCLHDAAINFCYLNL